MSTARAKHFLLLGLGFYGLLLGSGCVYWRLHQFREQLGAFARYGDVEHAPGPIIHFHKPVLKPEDIPWLIGREPTRKEHGLWSYDFQKREAIKPEPDHDRVLSVALGLDNGRIDRIILPPRFNGVVNENMLSRVLAGMDKAAVSRQNQTAGWILDPEIVDITPRQIRDMFGAPVRTEDTAIHRVWIYEFDLCESASPGAEPDGFALFVLNHRTDLIEQAHLRTGHLHVWVSRVPERWYSLRVKRGY